MTTPSDDTRGKIPTPPKQRSDHPTSGDRRLSDKQKESLKNEPAPAGPQSGPDLPDPSDVGEAG
jgi:hypothetical protein